MHEKRVMINFDNTNEWEKYLFLYLLFDFLRGDERHIEGKREWGWTWGKDLLTCIRY